MAITKLQSEALNLADDYTFTGSLSGQNFPAFQAYLSSNQAVTNNTFTKVQVNTEDFDTDSNYDNSTNYRFTPTTAGKYFVYAQVHADTGSGNLTRLTGAIYKNGSSVAQQDLFLNTSSQDITEYTSTTVGTFSANGSSDYFELYARLRTYSGSGLNLIGGTTKTFFGAYKIGN